MNDKNMSYLLGMTLASAVMVLDELQYPWRLVRSDSIVASKTESYVDDRINIGVDNGKVTSVYYG